MIRTFLLAAFVLVAFAADDMPKAAEAALEKSKTANAKTFIAWKQAVEKDRAALIKTLEGILATESKKKGNDAAVTALKAKLDELKKDDWIAAAIKEQSADADDLLGEMMTDVEVKKAIAGFYKSHGTWHMTFDEKGHVVIAYKDKGNWVLNEGEVIVKKGKDSVWTIIALNKELTWKAPNSTEMIEGESSKFTKIDALPEDFPVKKKK